MTPVCELCGAGWFKHVHNHASKPDCSNYRKLSGKRNQCGGCGEYFNSEGAFVKHRTGEHGNGRRCKTIAEMLQADMVKNAAGVWVGGLRLDDPENWQSQPWRSDLESTLDPSPVCREGEPENSAK